MPALNHFLLMNYHVVTQIIKAELVIRSVGYVAGICLAALGLGLFVNDKSARHSEETVDLTHPLAVSFGKVIVYGNDMYALAGQSVKICRQR